nr:LysR family transcriptional regulator [Paenibacillus sp. GSMTC-2017]
MKQLEYFMAVCKELHFTRSAEKLGIAQPSLSQQIRLLEHEIGTPLFDRIGKKTVITEAGKILQNHCYSIFEELSQAQFAINELQGLQRGTLKIGALLTVVNYLLPEAVIEFHRSYPNIELSVLGLRTGDIYSRLLQNELDLGIVMLPMEHDELEVTPLYKDNLAFAVPIDHPIAKHDEAKIDLLQQTSSILLPNSYFMREIINEHCRLAQFTPRPILEMTTMESIITMVEKGAGITILPKAYLEHIDNKLIQIVPIHEPVIGIEIGVVYRKNKRLGRASGIFLEQLLAAVKR